MPLNLGNVCYTAVATRMDCMLHADGATSVSLTLMPTKLEHSQCTIHFCCMNMLTQELVLSRVMRGTNTLSGIGEPGFWSQF